MVRSLRPDARLLKVRDVALMLSVSTATVYSLIERAKLASVGNSLRVPAESVDAIQGKGDAPAT